MKTINVKLCEITTTIIPIGFEGEQNHTLVVFDASPIFSDYPNASVSFAIRPPTGDVYMKSVQRDGFAVLWNVSAADCANKGNGAYQITFTDGDEVIKSWIGFTKTEDSLIGNANPPTPVAEWMQEASAALNDIENLSASAETLEPGSSATAEITEVEGHKNIVFGIPEGEQGEPGEPGNDGFSPIVSVEEITGGHRIIVTDKNGSQSFDVLDGEKGDPGNPGDPGEPGRGIVNITKTGTSGNIDTYTIEYTSGNPSAFTVTNGTNGTDGVGISSITKTGTSGNVDTYTILYTNGNSTTFTVVNGNAIIDDTAGVGDTTKVWSANKSATEVSALNSAITNLQNSKAPVIFNTASGAVASFADGADDLPVQDLKIKIEPVQSGSGDPSPTNVRPITGWTGATISYSGEDTSDPETLSISWQTEAGTVYGGELDVTTGVLMVDGVKETFVGDEEENWSKSNGRSGFSIPSKYLFDKTNSAVCNMFVYRTDSSGTGLYLTNAGDAIVIQNVTSSIASNVSDWKDWLEDNNLEVVYYLATPITYQLTPHELKTLLGTNNIWADTGDTEVTYRADTGMFVAEMAKVQDVQVNGTSVVQNGVANIPIANESSPGVAMVSANLGTRVINGVLATRGATAGDIKFGTNVYKPICPNEQGTSVFYGMASAAGDTTQKNSSNSVGTYTEDAKSKISDMLNAPVSVSGSTPSITAKSGVRYICGEVSTLSITAPESGIIDVVFTSGSTATVLTVTSAKSGVTAIKWANGFDPTSLDANTTYEVNIMDGEFGVVGSWT